jgi:hypothetical protein
MGLIDRLKQVLKAPRGERPKAQRQPGRRAARGDVGNLPGGASAKEAAEANPQRAAELAD